MMMDKKEIFRKVGDIIHELNDQYQHLSKTPGNLNELEIELFVANANFLADHLKIIQKLNAAEASALLKTPEKPEVDQPETAAAHEQPVMPAVTEQPAIKEKSTQETNKPEPAGTDTFRFEIDTEDESDIDDIQEEPIENKEEAKPSEPAAVAAEPVVKEVIIREKTISVDTPLKDASEPAPTLNDVMAAQLDQSTVAGKYNRQSVTDLKTIISLNDKMLFVKDLFNGYSLAYSEAIELINRFDNFNSADNFLKNNYSSKNNWSEKQQTVDKFYEILNRRFTK
jgi:hypothetical protein